MSETSGDRAVLVTTAHRGVFFGYASDVIGNDEKFGCLEREILGECVFQKP